MSPEARRRALARLTLVYFASFAVVGGMVPYLALEFQGWGLSGPALAAALGALPLGRLLAGPGWALLADRFQAPGRVLRAGSVLALAGAGLLAAAAVVGVAPPPVAVVAAMFLFAVGRAPMGPVVDGLALGLLSGDRLAYGRLRRWGSLGFLLAALASGPLRARAAGTPLVVGAIACLALLVVLLRLPAGDRLEPVRILPALRRLLRDPAIRWIVVAAALHFAAHVGSTSFLALHMDALGMSTSWTGVALAVGVAVEIGVMTRSAALLGYRGPARLWLLAILVAVPRWLLTARATTPAALVALQSLHGITFGAFWVAGVQLVSSRAPREVAHSAQALFSASVGGVGALLGMAGASLLVERLPTRSLFDAGAVLAGLASLAALRATLALRRAP